VVKSSTPKTQRPHVASSFREIISQITVVFGVPGFEEIPRGGKQK
jgi:hypothetical protein